jgi:hypothetical protein
VDNFVEIISKMACGGPVARYPIETPIVKRNAIGNVRRQRLIRSFSRGIDRTPMIVWLVNVTFVDALHWMFIKHDENRIDASGKIVNEETSKFLQAFVDKYTAWVQRLATVQVR